MKTNRIFSLIAVAFLGMSPLFAQTPTATQNLDNGIAAEKQGDNIAALTCYLQALTADKSLTEAKTRAKKVIQTLKENVSIENEKADPSPSKMIKIRNSWDKLLQAATDFLVSNQPSFEIRYFDSSDTTKLQRVNYQDGTVDLSVTISPYIYQRNSEVNEENCLLVSELQGILSATKHSNEWQLKSFPFEYAYYIDREAERNYQRNITKNKLQRTEEISLSFVLMDGSKKVYCKPWSDGTVRTCEAKYFFTIEYGTTNTLGYEVSTSGKNTVTFYDVPAEYAEKKLSAKLEKSKPSNILVIKAPKNVYSTVAAIEHIKKMPENANETLKVVVCDYSSVKKLADAVRECKGKVFLDLSESNGLKYIGGSLENYWNEKDTYTCRYSNDEKEPAFENCTALTGIILPNDLKKLGDRVFSGCTSLSSVTIPLGVTEFGVLIFENCPLLTELMLPASVKEFSYKTFYEEMACWTRGVFDESSIKTIYYGGTEEQWKSLKLFIEKYWHFYNGNAEKAKRENIDAKLFYECTSEKLPELQKLSAEWYAKEEAKAREESERLAAEKKAEEEAKAREESERLAAEKKAEEERLAAEKQAKERGAALWKAAEEQKKAAYVAHPEKGVPFNLVPYVIQNLKSDARIKVTGVVPRIDGDNCNFSIIANALKKSQFLVHLDLSALGFRNFRYGHAFQDCTQLSGITIPKSVKYIAGNAFKNCTSLKVVNYCGSKAQWNDTFIDKEGNKPLRKAKINYDYEGE